MTKDKTIDEFLDIYLRAFLNLKTKFWRLDSICKTLFLNKK
jgi:hypothetical protein